MIFGLSFAGELISAFIVDPITFGLPGYDLGQIPLRNLLQDGLYFVLLYLVWSLLYLQLSGKLLVAATTRLPIRPSPLIKQRWLILPVRLRE